MLDLFAPDRLRRGVGYWGNDGRFQEDHFWPVSTHPHLQEDPENKRRSHAGGNRGRGNGAPIVDLGIPSREWV